MREKEWKKVIKKIKKYLSDKHAETCMPSQPQGCYACTQLNLFLKVPFWLTIWLICFTSEREKMWSCYSYSEESNKNIYSIGSPAFASVHFFSKRILRADAHIYTFKEFSVQYEWMHPLPRGVKILEILVSSIWFVWFFLCCCIKALITARWVFFFLHKWHGPNHMHMWGCIIYDWSKRCNQVTRTKKIGIQNLPSNQALQFGLTNY